MIEIIFLTMISWVQQWEQLHFPFNPVSETLSIPSWKSSVYKTSYSLWCFTCWDPWLLEKCPSCLCAEAICSLWGWAFGAPFRLCFYGSSPCSLKCCSIAEVHIHAGWQTLCASMPSFANLSSGPAVLALYLQSLELVFSHSVHCGFLTRICSLWILTVPFTRLLSSLVSLTALTIWP